MKKLPAKALIILIRAYRVILSPSEGIFRFLPFYPKPTCIFHPTCSAYAIECFKKYTFLTALRKAVNRIGRCHPGNQPRVDLP